jgi:hypothetical protein
MASRWQPGALALAWVIQLATPAMAAEQPIGWGASELDAWLPLPQVLDQPLLPEWSPRLERTPMANVMPQRQQRRGPGGAGGPGLMGALPQDGIFDFMRYLRVPSPRIGNMEFSAAVAGLHTESDQPSARSEMGMDGGPGSTFQVAAKYLVDRHVSVTFGLNGAQAQTQVPSTEVAAAPRTRPSVMRGFASIGPSMVQRLVSTTVQPSASIQYAGPYGLNVSLGVASNPLDTSGAADVQLHCSYRTDFRTHRLPAVPAPLGPAVGPVANR